MTQQRQDYLDIANIIVNRIVADLTDRRGLSGEWEQIDEDIRNEIEQKWNNIAYEEISKLED